MMRIFAAGKPRMPMSPTRSKKVDCDDIQKVMRPLASQSAIHPCGSYTPGSRPITDLAGDRVRCAGEERLNPLLNAYCTLAVDEALQARYPVDCPRASAGRSLLTHST